MTTPALNLPSTETLASAVAALDGWMIDTLGALVAAPSPSGAEQPAVAVFEQCLLDLGLASERIVLDQTRQAESPLFSCPCDPDGGRYNLLARHLPPDAPAWGRSLLFNGHLDVVPTGPEALWQHPPFAPRVVDGWLHGRGAGDMKAGLVCALLAYKALATLGWQPAGMVGFNAVLDEENTGNGTLATVQALQDPARPPGAARGHGPGLVRVTDRAKLCDFDAVIIPEPFGETLMSAQVGVSWLFVTLTGKPAHVGYMQSGLNPIEAALAVFADLRQLQTAWNEPARRHPAFADVAQPININLGRIEGGEWNSSVPCTCTMGLRVGYYPGQSPDAVLNEVEARVRASAARINPALGVAIEARGHRSPGCVYDLEAPALQALAQAHEQVHGTPPRRLACTATTDGRHFRLLTDWPVTNYGPLARDIHGIDEAVELASMRRVATVMARYIADWCGLLPR
jgi:acetylornithine deacetylase